MIQYTGAYPVDEGLGIGVERVDLSLDQLAEIVGLGVELLALGLQSVQGLVFVFVRVVFGGDFLEDLLVFIGQFSVEVLHFFGDEF